MVCSNSPRSIRKPMESNSMMGRISKEVKRLKTWEESSTSAAESISIGLSGIADLYNCIIRDMTQQQSLSLHKHEKRVRELLEASSKLLEVCSVTRELVFQMKQASRDHQLDLSHGDSAILSYISSRKKIIRSSRKILSSLRRIGGVSFDPIGGNGDGDAIQALKCIIIISISIQETLLLFLGTRTKCVGRTSSIFSRLMSKGKRQYEYDEVGKNELENADVVICGLLSSNHQFDERIKLARKRLEGLETGVQGIESGLDSMFRQLTQTRVMLLKISSSRKNTNH